ncbi:hypothetical protein QWJ26_34190 [Streptomyces sp. CSDS2]|uniref:hypothetical protein n=1 Tax=Streptomyces sp. CSDS2 TaxID=3055051 RepID=UPI0025B09EB7|nr:hypothetical protein [Streptomyces sp. CSDS2]MDN3264765.1 hypothetical protein [Streptomyces sp. CSDS2]
MALKKALACTLTALAMAGGAASTASAADDDDNPKFDNSAYILSCDTVEVIDIPILSSANNNIDCSKNYEEEHKKVVIVDDSDSVREANLFLKKDEYR